MNRIAAALLPAFLLISAFLLLPVLPAAAQEDEDFDDLFEGEIVEDQEDMFDSDLFEEPAEEESEEDSPEEAFLVSEQLEWGGSFDLIFTTRVGWDDYIAPWEQAFWQDGSSSLASELSADLFFDARPDRDFRVFGKAKATYQYPTDWDVEIFELFSDFQIKDLLFFRAGKQTVQWGVGYFFSPADVLNLVSIDPEDPEAEREGPIAVKTHFPFAAHNLYLYLVANDIDRPYEIAVAPKVELLLGNYELGIGGFYQIDQTPKAMLTLTGPFWELDLFAEAMVQWGSDRTYVRSAALPPFYETYTIGDQLLFSSTAGFSYINSDWNLAVFAQYFFNDQGYQQPFDSSSLAVVNALLAGDITSADTLYPGRHYLAASVSWSEIRDSDIGLSLLYLANFSDGSGLITPTLTWDPIDQISLSTGISVRYGATGDEYGPIAFDPSGGLLAWTFTVSLGGGRF